MAYDYESGSSRSESRARQPADAHSSSYRMALAIWIAPAIVTGLLMIALNLRKYDTVLAINYESDEFLQTQQRTACGWPYVIASSDPATGRWSLSGFGVSVDGIIVFAAVVIAGATSRYIAAFVDYDVNRPIQKQVQWLFHSKSKKAAPKPKRSSASGAPRHRRPRRPTDD